MMGLFGNTQQLTIENLAYDVDGNLQYLGKAAPGTLDGDATWSIKKLSYDVDGNLSLTEWANGDSSFAYVWNDRLAYTYS